MRTDIENLIAKLHPLERKVLPSLEKVTSFHEIVGITGLQEVEVMRALQWLQNKDILKIKEEIREVVELDKNGKLYLEKGLPEKRFLKAQEGATVPLPLATIQKNSNLDNNEITICIGVLKKRGLIGMKKENNEILIFLTEEGKKIFHKETDEEKFIKGLQFPKDIKDISQQESAILREFLARKLLVKINVIKLRSVELTELGKMLITYNLQQDFKEQITAEMLQNKSWGHYAFRHYDVTINVPEISGGKRHPVSQAISYIKQIWLDMGFVEMNGALVQTSYWDLDALFVPQDHSARQMQDTFFLKDETGKDIIRGKLPSDYAKIKETHETGGKTGSSGWQAQWHENEAKKVLLRTHTTVLSALKLAELGKDTKTVLKKLPLKFFNVGRVFRNEALDWKHLFEFHQVDGIVIDKDANLQHLKAYLHQFFGKMGYQRFRIRPAYFPYTEPSLEVEVWHPKKKEWVELGGAGIFRPEVVVPLLGYDIPVLAWGIGLERVISEYYSLTDIRELYKNDMRQLQAMKMWIR